MRLDRKGFQEGMRFLRWAAGASEEQIRAVVSPPIPPAKSQKCWRCQRGRGLFLCVSCGVSVKAIVRRCLRSHERRP